MKIICFFLFLFASVVSGTDVFAKANSQIDVIKKVKSISKQFEWKELGTYVDVLSPHNELDTQIALVLLVYHYERLGFKNTSEEYSDQIAARDHLLKLGIDRHPLFGSINKVITLLELARQPDLDMSSTFQQVTAFYQSTDYKNELDWFFGCIVKKSLNLNDDLLSSQLRYYDCNSITRHFDVKERAMSIHTGGYSDAEINEMLITLTSHYSQAASIYEKLDISLTLALVAAASQRTNYLLSSINEFNRLTEIYQFDDPELVMLHLTMLQGLRNIWPEFQTTFSQNWFHEYLSTFDDPQARINELNIITLNTVLDGLIHEQGWDSDLTQKVIKHLATKFDQYVQSDNPDMAEFPQWIYIIDYLHSYYQYIEGNNNKAVAVLFDYLKIFEKYKFTEAEQLELLANIEQLQSVTSFEELDQRFFTPGSFHIETSIGLPLADFYFDLAEALWLSDEPEKSGQYYYKSLFSLPANSRLSWHKSVEIFARLSQYQSEYANNENLEKYFFDKVLVSAKAFIFGKSPVEAVRRLENLERMRQALVDTVFYQKFNLYPNNDQHPENINELNNNVFELLQLIRLNRVTLVSALDSRQRKSQMNDLNESSNLAKNLFSQSGNGDILEVFSTDKADIKLRQLSEFQDLIPDDVAIVISYDGWFDTNFAFIDNHWFDPQFTHIKKQELKKKIGKILTSVKLTNTSQIPAFDYASSAELYEFIFETAYGKVLFKDKKHIVFLPSQSLFNFPLTLLHNGKQIFDDGSKNYRYDPDGFLIDKYRVSHALDIYDELLDKDFLTKILKVERKRNYSKKSFLGVANPEFGTAELAEIRGLNFIDLDQTANEQVKFSALPETVSEIQAASSLFSPSNVTTYFGSDASKENVLKSDMSTFDILMFSTHGVTPATINGFENSALVLSGTEGSSLDSMLLTSDDILKLSLNSELVILNSCSSGISNLQNAPGLTGLAQSFLAAGSRSIMVSHWDIASRETAALTSLMFSSLKANSSISYNTALQNAQKSLKSNYNTAHPFFWAAFTIYNNF